MERQDVIEPFEVTEKTVAAIFAHFDAILELCPFLKSIDEDTRKLYLKVEGGKITRQRAVYNALLEKPKLNKSDYLTIPALGAQINRYDLMFKIDTKAGEFKGLTGDTLLSVSHALSLDSNEGQKQIKRASEDDSNANGKLYKNVLNAKKQKAAVSDEDMAKWAAKNGYVKTPDEPKK